MGRLIDTSDLNNRIMLSKDEWGVLSVSLSTIFEDIVSKTPTAEPKKEQFAKWVAREIFDEDWEYNKDAFAEIACRKLAKLGIVRAKGDEWELIDPQESEDKE